jgi:Zn-dependent peptidase ImmA (M78 family)
LAKHRPAVDIERVVPIRLYPLTDFFKGLERVQALRDIFGDKTKKILSKMKVEFYSARWGYMGINDSDGHILISAHHMKHSSQRTLYLDILHELYHIKQHMHGKKLFLDEFDYFDSPIEIEAYEFTIKEARRIGMTDRQIVRYLEVPWADKKQLNKFVKRLGLKPKKS